MYFVHRDLAIVVAVQPASGDSHQRGARVPDSVDRLCCHGYCVGARQLRIAMVAGVALRQKDVDIHLLLGGLCCPDCSVHAHQWVTVLEAGVVLVRGGEDRTEDRGYVLLMDGLYCPGYSVHVRELIELVRHHEHHVEEHGYKLLVMDGPGCSVHAHELGGVAVLVWEDEDCVGQDS